MPDAPQGASEVARSGRGCQISEAGSPLVFPCWRNDERTGATGIYVGRIAAGFRSLCGLDIGRGRLRSSESGIGLDGRAVRCPAPGDIRDRRMRGPRFRRGVRSASGRRELRLLGRLDDYSGGEAVSEAVVRGREADAGASGEFGEDDVALPSSAPRISATRRRASRRERGASMAITRPSIGTCSRNVRTATNRAGPTQAGTRCPAA